MDRPTLQGGPESTFTCTILYIHIHYTLHSQFVNSTSTHYRIICLVTILPLLCIHTFKTLYSQVLYSTFTTWELHIHTLQGYKLLELLNSITDSHMHNSTFTISILYIHNLKPSHSHISGQLYIHTIINLHSRFLYSTFTLWNLYIHTFLDNSIFNNMFTKIK